MRKQVPNPEDGCTEVDTPKVKGPWIALVLRSQKDKSTCSFDTKVRRKCVIEPPHHSTWSFAYQLFLWGIGWVSDNSSAMLELSCWPIIGGWVIIGGCCFVAGD